MSQSQNTPEVSIDMSTTTKRERTPGDTSKAKPQIAKDLGMTEAALREMSICWVPFPMSSDLKRTIENVAIVRTTDPKAAYKVHTVLWNILNDAMTEELVKKLEEEGKEANRKTLADMNEEELAKKAKAAQAAYEKIMAELASRK